MGGLGNQMFQYAAARRLAHFNNTNLKIDLSWFDNICEVDSFRAYALDEFAIQESFATREEVDALKFQAQGFFAGLLTKTMGRQTGGARSYIREKQFHLDPDILHLNDGVYLDGYWQSEKYFKDIETIIRQEFTIKSEMTVKSLAIKNQIKSTNSVSLHIRRGDYVSNPHTKKYHGSCNVKYYFRCVENLTLKVKHPHFFVFSDDPEWTRVNLKLPYPATFVDHNPPEKGYEDLKLMSLCKNHIIANSSFSWWGAWLNPDSDKTVIAPDRWFNQEDIDTTDLLPETWIRL